MIAQLDSSGGGNLLHNLSFNTDYFALGVTLSRLMFSQTGDDEVKPDDVKDQMRTFRSNHPNLYAIGCKAMATLPNDRMDDALINNCVSKTFIGQDFRERFHKEQSNQEEKEIFVRVLGTSKISSDFSSSSGEQPLFENEFPQSGSTDASFSIPLISSPR